MFRPLLLLALCRRFQALLVEFLTGQVQTGWNCRTWWVVASLAVVGLMSLVLLLCCLATLLARYAQLPFIFGHIRPRPGYEQIP